LKARCVNYAVFKQSHCCAASVVAEAEKLHAALEDDERDFDEEKIYVAVYDSPIKLINRHNEIHIELPPKKEGLARVKMPVMTT
jgi:hypothetical protein